MKNFVKTITIALVIAALNMLLQPAYAKADQKELTIVSWGGAFTRSQILAQVIPYEKKTGIHIEVIDYNGGLKEVRAQVLSHNTKWDLVDMYLPDIIRGSKEGLMEKIDISSLPPAPDGTPAKKDFLEGGLMDYGVANTVSANIIAYKNETFQKEKPNTIADFFDIEKFPGKRGLRNSSRINLEWALIADGVPKKNIYETLATEEGLERAFKKLDTIKKYIIWWESGTEPAMLLEDNKVVMTSAWNGRIQSTIDKGANLTIIWDSQVWELELWCIPKRTRNQNLNEIMDFIRFATDTHRLANITKYISYGPARKSSSNLIPESIKTKLPTAPKNSKNAFKLDSAWWSQNQNKIDVEFAHWKAMKGLAFGGGTRP